MPDMEIAGALRRIKSDIQIQFASYATGAATLRKAGYDVCDLLLDENPTFVDSLLACHSAVKSNCPNIIIAHEEFGAITAAKIVGIPSLFLSAWLPYVNTIGADAIRHAQALIVVENPGIFQIPPGVFGRVHYVGPVIRKMKYSVENRKFLREEMKLPNEAAVILVVSGGWATEERAPFLDLVLSAFIALPQIEKHLIWVATADFDSVNKKLAGIRGVQVLSFQDPIERLLAIADVVLTKGTRGITMDAAAVGVPSVSLSAGQNPIDDEIVPRIHSNIALRMSAVNPEILTGYLQHVISSGVNEPLSQSGEGAELAAKAILTEIDAMRTVH